MDEDFSDINMDGGIDTINQDTIYQLESVSDGGEEEFPEEFMLTGTMVQDQRDCKYKNGCTRYGGSHVINQQNLNLDTSGNYLWIQAIENKLQATEKYGSSMSSFIAQAKNDGLTKGYASIAKDNHYLIKKRIYDNKPLFTGSNKINRVAMAKAKTNIAIINSGPGHIFALFGWNRIGYIFRDSFGLLRGDGHFIVRYEDVGSLYTLITFTTPEEHKNLKAIKDEEAKQKALTAHISNGKDLWENVTRGQVAIMIGRMRYGLLNEQILMNKMQTDGIWNGKRENDECIREEVFIMFGRYLGIKGDDNDIINGLVEKGITNGNHLTGKATREQIVIICGRILLSGM